MKKSYITGKNHDFYSRGKAMFDQIQPITQAIPQIPQIPQKDSSNEKRNNFLNGYCVGQADLLAEQAKQEPVEYQMRMRPTWEATSWSDWKKCSRDAAGDYAKTPKLHDWEYETRKLYAQPITQAIPQIPQEHSSKRTWVGLTGWEREAIAHECGAMSADWLVFMEAVERALKEKNT